MSTVRILTLCCWLALARGPGAQEPAPDPLTALLAQFPDNDLPTLIGRLARHDSGAHAALHALGSAAHEALLGAILHPDHLPYTSLASAFGEFDASCGWALPLLALPEVVSSNKNARDLLLRLGPAAAPALPGIEASAVNQAWLQPFVRELAAMTDGPMPVATAAPSPPRVERVHVPALLAQLRLGPGGRGWQALQALLRAGDEAATDALVVLLELTLQAPSPAVADLLTTLQYVYGTRCLHGWNPLPKVPLTELPFEARRLVLACRVDDATMIRTWLLSPDASLRLTAVLAIATMRVSPEGWPEALPVAADPDTRVQRIVDVVRMLRRRAGALAANAALPELSQDAGKIAAVKVIDVLRQLGRHDLHDAPSELWTRLALLASGAGAFVEDAAAANDPRGVVRYRRRTELGNAAVELFRVAASRSSPLPAVVTAALPLLKPCRDGEQWMRELLEAADIAEIELLVRAASERPAALAGWIAFLRAARWSKQQQAVLGRLGPVLVEAVPALSAESQLDWLEIGPEATAPDAVWRALLSSTEVAVRRRAIEAAWRGFHKRPVDLAIVLPSLEDPDFDTARFATFLFGSCRTERERAVAALAARYPTAAPPLQQWVVHALYSQREFAAAARATIDTAFASEHAAVRVPAAGALLRLDPLHKAAFAMVCALIDDSSAEVRQQALYLGGNDADVASRLVDHAIRHLEDADDSARSAAVRLLGGVPAARERSLPPLRELLRRESRNSMAGSRAERAIADLEKQAVQGK